jgi:lipopolysaccharide assembly outer membrane protein LptD (OstA)
VNINKPLRRRRIVAMLGAAFCLALAVTARAQTSAATVVAVPAPPLGVETFADTLNYDREAGTLEAVGNVVIRKGYDELRASYVRFDVTTEVARAVGNVRLKRPTGVWTGDKLEYNFKTGSGAAENLTVNAAPFQIVDNKRAEKRGDAFVMDGGRVTTCTNPPSAFHYCMTADSIEVVPEETLTVRRAVWRMGPVPVMYLPYWRFNLDPDFGLRLQPGYESRMGAFLLSSYRYRISPSLRATTHLDYRTKRGVAVGQDLRWRDPDMYTRNGGLETYFINDQEPLDQYDNPDTTDISSSRYRLKFREDYQIADRDHALVRAQYLSDSGLMEDFFEDEYRVQREPENYANYTHQGDFYTFGVLARMRLNDFYNGVERLPEISYETFRREVPETDLYYESQSSVSFLRQVWAKDSGTPDGDPVLRMDSSHMVYYPTRHFGFLNLTPRAGARATYYSATRDQIMVPAPPVYQTNLLVNALGQTNRVVQVLPPGTNQVAQEIEKGADMRALLELGFESSFKAFRMSEGLLPYRHVVEPYLNYTFVPEPSLTPDKIYQFDSIDELTRRNDVRLGVRNKLQIKRNNRPFDLADVDVYTLYRFDPEPEENALGAFGWNADLIPHPYVYIKLDGLYDSNDSTLQTFNSRVAFTGVEMLELATEYRYRDNQSGVWSGDITYRPSGHWEYNVYGRYETELARTEEVGGYFQRNLDCLSVRIGGSVIPGYTQTDGIQREDEFRILIAFWLRAFPDVGIWARHRN